MLTNYRIYTGRYRRVLLLIVQIAAGAVILLAPSSARALTTTLAVDLGYESVSYYENIPESSLFSEAKTVNPTTRLEARVKGDGIVGGLKVSAPLSVGVSREEWRTSGALTQTNNFSAREGRLTTFMGITFDESFTPYGGLSLVKRSHRRGAFVSGGTPFSTKSRELVRSLCLVIGVGGEGSLRGPLRWGYGLEYGIPLTVSMTNSVYPGFKVDDSGGYRFEVRGELGYLIRDGLTAVLSVYGGRSHWEGSNWIPHGGTLLKWPDNDTDHLGVMVGGRFGGGL